MNSKDYKEPQRKNSYGENGHRFLDAIGRAGSLRKIKRFFRNTEGKDCADFGCGYHAAIGTAIFRAAGSLCLVDVKISPHISFQAGNIQVIEGRLPEVLQTLPDECLDLILCNNILEHLDQDQWFLREVFRLLRPNGSVWVNVPSWRGKFWLETAAFRLGVAPAEEMEDHKRYYDQRDLWPLAVASGFLPSKIKLGSHKFGLNTYLFAQKG